MCLEKKYVSVYLSVILDKIFTITSAYFELDQWWANPARESRYLILPAEGPSTWTVYVICYICEHITALHTSV
jgi:hypothetical protein